MRSLVHTGRRRQAVLLLIASVGSLGLAVALPTATAAAAASSWTVSSPQDPGASDNYLQGVDCRSATWCMAVGDSYASAGSAAQAQSQTWNGSSWTDVAAVNETTAPSGDLAHGSDLVAVSCVSTTSCVAVGHTNVAFQSTGSSAGTEPVAETWNGTAWTLALPATPATETAVGYSNLSGVSCLSATWCTAVGSYFSSSGPTAQTLIETWNGSAWSIVSSPNPGTGYNYLNAVSCTSTTSCVAVGDYDDANSSASITAALTWNGTTWASAPPQNPGTGSDYLDGVSCTSSTWCVAVGNSSTNTSTLAETWNGTTWTVSSTPNGEAITDNQLIAVSCTSSTSCVAVGQYVDSSYNGGTNSWRTLAETWDGSTWSISGTPNAGAASVSNYLNAIACVSASSCVAVGDDAGSTSQTLALVYQPASGPWTVASSQDAGTSTNVLNGDSCVSASSCVAVGHYITSDGNNALETLAETWDGSRWTRIMPLNPGASGYDTLVSVSCVSASWCMAVGDSIPNSGYHQTLAETWNGSAWSVSTTPNAGPTTNNTNNNYLYGVSCVSTSSCIAVGVTTTSTGANSQTLAEKWDGTSWTILSTPNQGTFGSSLFSVSCTSASSCVAVGSYASSSAISHSDTLAESWNGTTWTASFPANPNTENVLRGISCTSSLSCMAVGFADDGTTWTTLADTWNGVTWTSTTPTNTTASYNALSGVSCVSATSCLAVGKYNNSTTTGGLAETWNGAAWTTTLAAQPPQPFYELNGDSCPASGFCAAVGDEYSAASNSQQTLAELYQAVVTTPTTTGTGVVAQPSPAMVGQTVTYIATVTPAPDGGTVSFTENGTTLTGCGTVAVDTTTGKASCTTSYPAVGSHTVVATYSGDTNYVISFGSTSEQVNQATTGTAVIGSPNPSSVGQSVTYTATVSPAPDGGTVAFTDNGAAMSGCGTAAVSTTTGKATCTTSYAATGSHSIVATYSGDTNYAGSNGSTTQQVQTVVVGGSSFAPNNVGPLSAAVAPDGTQLVFWHGLANHLFEGWYSGGSWHGPADLSAAYFHDVAPLQSAPSAALTADGSTQVVFWQGAGGHLFEAWYASGAWHGPVDISAASLGSASLGSSPAAAMTPDGHQQLVFWRGAANHLFEAWYAAGSWHGPADISAADLGGTAPLASAPSATVTRDGSTQLVFWQGAAGGLTEAWYAGGAWHGPLDVTATRFGGTLPLASSPTVTTTPDGTQQLVYWRTGAGHLAEGWYAGGSWHGPLDLTAGMFGGAGPLSSAPSAAVTPDGSTQLVFWPGAGQTLWEAWYTGHWNGPRNLSAG